MLGDIVYRVANATIALLASVAAACAVFYGVSLFHAQRTCLQAGYPEATIDYTGDGYCLNLEGSVRATVEALP